ncbi:MAG: AAA family ATPase [Leptolyngbya sp. SIO3F4]|nr:AAA family ATPase [Leptolyngbya sp. SIO3F4]
MEIKQLITDALRLPTNAIAYHISKSLTQIYPDREIVEGSECSFDLETFAREGQCAINLKEVFHNHVQSYWDGTHQRTYQRAENARFEVTWQNHTLDVLLMTWSEGWNVTNYYWILADTFSLADSFFAAVCDWNSEVRDELLVFEDGRWSKSPRLFQEIKSATFENLVLSGNLKDEIRTDLQDFFAARSTYGEYGVPWKRGVLLIGPPGNGKTHTVKALVNLLEHPCLYVKSFKAEHGPESRNIRKVFSRARQLAPCLLILEDLDSLVDDENRSFFLNELDGFAANDGIVTIATTNHPEKLDVAILERPSRFDRKYHFALPAVTERDAYIRQWNEKLRSEMQLTDTAIQTLARDTEGFSFAYLRELLLAMMVRWMHQQTSGAMPLIALEQLAMLKTQMKSLETV